MPGRRRGSRLALGLACAVAAGSCSVALVHGPPSPDEADYDPTGRYGGSVPCTSSRAWPIVDAAVLLATLVKVANYGPEQRDETLSGLLGAAAFGISAVVGILRTNACRDAQAAAVAGPPIGPPVGPPSR
jgi:hypothetical protein